MRCRMCAAGFDGVGRQEFCSGRCRGLFWFHKQTKGPDQSKWRIQRERAVFPVGMSSTEAAYAAGFFDGEGHIGVTRRFNGTRPAYSPKMGATNTNRDVMEYLAKILGGNGQAYRRTPAGGRSKDIFTYTLSRKQLLEVLPQMQPYLVVKKRMAVAALKLARLLEGPRTDERDRACEELYLECRALNLKGRT